MSVTLLLILTAAAAAAPETPIAVGQAKHLFLDDHLVASMSNVTRTIHPARKFENNPVLRPTEAWEGDSVILYGSVIQDDGKFRMWYHAEAGVCYAESEDGLTWTKPPLDVVVIDGQSTNIVVDRKAEPGAPGAFPYFYEVFGVHKDLKEPDPARRYKMGYLSIERDYSGPRQDPFHGGQRRGLGVAGSPDGIHWTVLGSWTTEAICDGATHWMFDPARDTYILYGRTKFVPEDVQTAWKGDAWFDRQFWGRAVARVESPDFLHWDYSDPASAPVVMCTDTQDEVASEIYSMQVFPYESGYIGLVQVFHSRPEGTRLELQLAASQDSQSFTRVGDRTPFIPCGPVGSWDRYNNSAANNPPLIVGDELRFYYGGRTSRHSPYEGTDKGLPGGYVGMASVARDRLVSLDGSYDGAVLVTKPLRLEGATLHLNAQATFGAIVVEVLDAAGDVLAVSEPLHEDRLDLLVAWTQGGLDGVTSPVTLRFTLTNAAIYAVWCS